MHFCEQTVILANAWSDTCKTTFIRKISSTMIQRAALLFAAGRVEQGLATTTQNNMHMYCKASLSGERYCMVRANHWLFFFIITLFNILESDMFHLWSLAEQDLLAENVPYRLRDTGQGLNRVQAAPKTSRMMYAILHRAQKSVGTWVGSSVIHMGDTAVPNALMFIGMFQLSFNPSSSLWFPFEDKYSQIYRILLPICNVLSQIPSLSTKPALRSYIEAEFGSTDDLIHEILRDFFRHGFDGSGGDDFFNAGSCIDGRLTSAWNWCATLEKKRFFSVFLLTGQWFEYSSLDESELRMWTGFVGFDGEWWYLYAIIIE